MKSLIWRRARSLMLIASLLVCAGTFPQTANAEESVVEVYFRGEPVQFADARPVIQDGRTLVPFRKIFETLGFAVKWVDGGNVQKAIGTKDGLVIELTIGSTVAKVNGKTTALDVPAQTVEGRTLVPLRFVSENSGYRVAFASDHGVSKIRIEPAGEADGKSTQSPGNDKAEPYVVKGRVTDAEGRPVKGAEVFADNQLLYNSNLTAVTDQDGYYRIELPLLATTWKMGGSHNVVVDGKPYTTDLTPEVDGPFAGNTGAVRNFTLKAAKQITGELYLYMDINSFVNGYIENNVELTLTPVGGSGGKAKTGYGYNFPGGFGMNDIPVGRYKATAVYAAPGEEPVKMLVRVRNKGQYAESVEFGFSTLVPGIEQAEIEVMMP